MTENSATISPPPAKSSCVRKSILFSLLLGLILIGLFLLGNYYYGKIFSSLATTKNNLYLAQKNMSSMEQQVSQLTTLLKNQNETINALRQTQTGYNRDQWRVSEADFLVKLANDKIHFENNFSLAITLLQAADQEIRDLNDAQLLPVRKALASDIVALQAVPAVDTTGIYLHLAALNEQISTLPLPNKPSASTGPVVTTVNENLPWWKRGLEQTWQQLQKIVVIRYNQKGPLPLIMPDQQTFLLQNLHAILEKSMWALLHRQPDIYQSSLNQAVNWINQYFVADSSITQSVTQQLTQLSQININPALPQNLDSLQAFKDYFASQHQQ